ncbi:S-layer homology domain-containing protein [Patescibacteria group bacterium]|nr:S-layer homology domain-containing protein [Patescibacteria group bacterium]
MALQTEKQCYTPKEVVDITLGKNTTEKDLLVYQALLKSYDLTMFTNTDEYKPDNYLKRYEAAKMFVNFAKHILCREKIQTYNNQYSDIVDTDATLKPYIIEAYEYGILKGAKGLFRPLDRMNRKEFIAALMRMFTNQNMDVYGQGNDRDSEYIAAFKQYELDDIVGDDSDINRYDMSKIMYKLYYNTSYEWTDKGYVLPYGRE